MQDSCNAEERSWYVLNFFRHGSASPKKFIDEYNKEGHAVELFAPIIRPAAVVNGKIEYREKLLTFYYIFACGTLEEIKELCSRPNNPLSLMLDRGSVNRYGMLSDAEMNNFKIIARAYANEIPFFNIEHIELSEGDLVQVVGGNYDGLVGTFMPKARSNKGNLVIAATHDMGAVVWDIDAKYVRILEFAKDTRRQYDLVDSFIPKLLPILRKFHAGESLDDKEKSQLNVFNRRMGVAVPANHKAEAKLLAVLMCVQFILGDMASLSQTSLRYSKRKEAVTNPWGIALAELLQGATRGDMPRIKAAYLSVKDAAPEPNKAQARLLEEFRHYLCYD